jgi:uncharacterized hydrophobic protein (TIGR00341 family)
MPLRLIEVFAGPGNMDTVEAIAEHYEALNVWREPATTDDGKTEAVACRILARPEKQQELIDQIQAALGKEKPWRITIMPVEATIPELEEKPAEGPSPQQATREELYAEIARGARIDSTFVALVVLSTVVATIGLLKSNIPVVIGAMLIAPLLGPNTAMAFGSTLGDRELVWRGGLANAVGLALAVACAALAGIVFPIGGPSPELLARTKLGYDSILLALASGAAGALSLTTGLSSILVGVMVAVALLPPAVTLGYMLGFGDLAHAWGAAALLAVNIVCVNLSAQLVFLTKGIKPRTWIERRAAQQSTVIGLGVTLALLAVLIGVIYLRHG